MEPAGEDLAALNCKIRALRARECRAVAKEAETVSATYLGERKIHKVAMMVFVLSGHDAAVAADFSEDVGVVLTLLSVMPTQMLVIWKPTLSGLT